LKIHPLYICLNTEIVLQCALRYSFALLSKSRFSEFEGENFFPADAFAKKNFPRRKQNKSRVGCGRAVCIERIIVGPGTCGTD